MSRDYKHEYDSFQSSSSSKKDRVKRNRARRRALKLGIVKKGDNKNIHHIIKHEIPLVQYGQGGLLDINFIKNIYM